MGQGLLRDRLLARLAEMGDAPDYVRLAEEVLTIRNAPEPLARRLVAQALVVEDRRDAWLRVGESACGRAPSGPGVYFFRDAGGTVLYVGKALNLRRRLLGHFAPGRWRRLKPLMARVASVEWEEVGSDLEALLVEFQRIQELRPAANVQRERGAPPQHRAKNVVLLLPSADAEAVLVVAARADGAVLSQSTPRDGSTLDGLVEALLSFFAARVTSVKGTPEPADASLASIVFAWLRHRGAYTTRFDASETVDAEEWHRRLALAFASSALFRERLIFR